MFACAVSAIGPSPLPGVLPTKGGLHHCWDLGRLIIVWAIYFYIGIGNVPYNLRYRIWLYIELWSMKLDCDVTILWLFAFAFDFYETFVNLLYLVDTLIFCNLVQCNVCTAMSTTHVILYCIMRNYYCIMVLSIVKKNWIKINF